MTPAAFTVPMPPSVNHAYRNIAKGRAKTRAAKEWETHALWHLKAQKIPSIDGQVLVIFGFERPSPRADVTNRIKLCEDVIVKAGVIEDDRFVTGGAYAWLPRANGLVHVTVMPSQALTAQFIPAPDGAGWSIISQEAA